MTPLRPSSSPLRPAVTDQPHAAARAVVAALPPGAGAVYRARPARTAPAPTLYERQWGPVDAQPGQRVVYLIKKMYMRYASFPRQINKELHQLGKACAAFDAAGGDSLALLGKYLAGVARQGRAAVATLQALERVVAASPECAAVQVALRAALAAGAAR